MRKFFVNIFATTGISFLLLSMIAFFFQAKCIYLETAFQILGANIVVHFGLVVLSKIELKYAIVEFFLHIIMILSVMIVFGSVFNWFTSTPIGVLVTMGFVIYIVSAILNLFSMKRDAQEINALIKKRDRKP